MNILHEFEPEIRHIVNEHAPKFVSKFVSGIDERITNDHTLSGVPPPR